MMSGRRAEGAMMTGSKAKRSVLFAFGVAAAILLALGGFAYRSVLLTVESDRWLQHTHEVLENLQDLQFAMEGVASASRGYTITGEERYLEPYHAAGLSLMEHTAIVRNLTADNAEQQRRIPALEKLATERLENTDETINLRRDRGLVAATEATQTGRGLRITTEYQAIIAQMEGEEQRLLVLRNVETERNRSRTKIILILGSVLGLLITVAAGWRFQQENSRREAAEDTLRESERKYRLLIDGVKEYAIMMLGPLGEIRSWNPGAERMSGCTYEEVAGQNYSRFFTQNEIKLGRPEEILRLAAANGEFEELGMRVRKDGTRYQVRTSFTASRDPAGILRGFSIVSRDLSESKESEVKYRGLLEAAPDAMVVVNQGGEIVLLNVQAEKQFGYRRDELLGQKVTNIIPVGFAERLIADDLRSTEDASAQQIGTGIELIAQRKDGGEFPIEIMLSPLESTEGTLVTAAIRNISVRKAAETHLSQMEGRYRGLLEAAPDAMVVVNQSGEIVLLNVQAEKQFGYRRDELLGQKVTNIIPIGFAERLIADDLRSAEDASAQQIGTGIELIAQRKDGSEFPIEIMLSPLRNAEGILVTAAIRDITTRKKAAALLLQKVEELYRSNEELGQFAYIASHDLQEPLRMVASYTQLLSSRYKGKLDSDADEFIAFAVDGASRMQRLIQDLLTYSRVGTKGKDLIETSSEDALQQALINLRGAIEDSGALVTHDPLPPVLADETQLIQLFQNLVGNAIKYQRPGVPKVHVSAVRNGGKKWNFSVQDNGLGIDPQYFEKIFGMFQRLHKRDEFAGTGIGLTICKKIVERHGGNISVESQPGQGSTFRFALAGR
jgi:PAS domain S-box-containing protein